MTLELLFPHFDELIRTPEDVQRLNEAILQLAVQGKLVPQDPEDEPVIELLRQNRSQSEQLRVEDGTRTRVGHDPIVKTVPFVIPAGWVWIRLGEIVESMTNGIYKPASFYDDRGIACLRMYNIQAGAISFHDLKRMELTADELQTYGLRAGDLIVNRVNSRELVGKAAVIPALVEPLVYESKNIRVRFRAGCVQPEFVSILLRTTITRSIFDEIAKQTTGQASINQTQLSDLQIPLPPLAEQHRIVAKVDELFAQTRALEAKLRQAQADIVTANRAALHRLHRAQDDGEFQAAWCTLRDHFDLLYDDPRNVADLRQAILDLAVRGKLVPQDAEDEPAGEFLRRIEAERQRLVKERLISAEDTGQLRLDSILHVPIAVLGEVRSGIQKSNIRTPKDNPRRYITVAHVQRNRIDPGDPRYFEVSNEELEKWRLVSGDVLVIEGNGSAEHIGRAALFLGEIEDCVHQNHVIRIRPNRAFILPEYLNLYLNSPSGRDKILERSRTTSGLYNLSVGRIRTIEVPLPALTRQHRIVAKVDQLMRLCDALQAGLVQAEVQRRSLTAAVLSGICREAAESPV